MFAIHLIFSGNLEVSLALPSLSGVCSDAAATNSGFLVPNTREQAPLNAGTFSSLFSKDNMRCSQCAFHMLYLSKIFCFQKGD